MERYAKALENFLSVINSSKDNFSCECSRALEDICNVLRVSLARRTCYKSIADKKSNNVYSKATLDDDGNTTSEEYFEKIFTTKEGYVVIYDFHKRNDNESWSE